MEREIEALNYFDKRLKSHHDGKSLAGKYVKSIPTTRDELTAILSEKPRNVPKAIYVHTPYCDKICSFCNLNRKQIEGSLDEYAQYLADQFEIYGKTTYFEESQFQVVFFGGGTPTVFNPNQLMLILESIKKNVRFAPNYEFTFESTLHNLNPEKLKIMMEYGVNRLSVGIQTFNDNGRIFYNRTYSRREAIKRLQDLKNNFIGDVCVDIIYNYPNQTIEEVKEDARLVKELELSSASFYSLMVHEGSKLSQDINEEKVQVDNELKRDYELYNGFLEEVLKGGQYYVLELTKVARKNADNYQYIKVRNNGGDTFPIGIGAGGNIGNIGMFNMNKEMSFFMKHDESVNRFSRISGLLQFPKVSINQIKEFLFEEEYKFFQEKMEYYEKKNLVIKESDNYVLTKDGIFWGNNIASETVTHILESVFKNKL